MGCYPLKEMIARAFGKCNGKEKRRSSHRMMYSPPPSYSHNAYSHQRATVVKTVNFSNHNPIIIIPPEPEPGPPVSNHHPEPVVAPSPPRPGPTSSKEHEVTKRKKSKRTRFAPGPPETQDNVQPAPTQHKPYPDYQGSVQHEPNSRCYGPAQHEPGSGHQGPVRHEPGPAYRGPVPYYAPSPLPRWEYGQGRQEYFSGEYRTYPTPIREGIYNIATDPHRLTTIFSEENPNACSIV